MPIAFSRSRIVVADVDGTTVSLLRAGLDAALRAAGWVGNSVADGFRYTITSRQGLAARCYVRDLGAIRSGLPCLTIQFASSDGVLIGREHVLATSEFRTAYNVIANHCQVFIGLPGYGSIPHADDTAYSYSVCGGVPFVPQDLVEAECGLDQEVTDAWWSSGSGPGYTFRSAWLHGDQDFSTCFNGVVQTRGEDWEKLRLGVVANPFGEYGAATTAQKTQYVDGSRLYFDPLLLWGSPVARVRAQLWDAMLGSTDAPLDDEITSTELNPDTGSPYTGTFAWRNYMHYQGDMDTGSPGSYFASLYLLTQPPAGFFESNYAY